MLSSSNIQMQALPLINTLMISSNVFRGELLPTPRTSAAPSQVVLDLPYTSLDEPLAVLDNTQQNHSRDEAFQ
jgi:hypothetical protein